MPLFTLPNEILIQIGKELDPWDLDRFIRTNRRLDFLLTPVLHKIAVSSEISPAVGDTVFIWAAGEGYVRLLGSLLAHGSDIQAFNIAGWTALMNAAYKGQVAAVRLLLDKGASMTAQDPAGFGESALHCAAIAGQTEVARVLLEGGADIDAKTVSGATPLHSAVVRSLELSELLLEKGADIDAQNNSGETPLLYAASDEYNGRAQPERDAGDDPEGALEEGDHRGEEQAGEGGEVSGEAIVRILVDKGANVHLMNSLGVTPLHCAAGNGYTEMVKILLENGAEIDAKDSRGCTPLFWAAEGSSRYRYLGNEGRIAVLRLLLEKGADIHAVDCEGKTIRQWGSTGNVLFCDLLEEFGQDVQELRECESGPDTSSSDDQEEYEMCAGDWGEHGWSGDSDDNEDDDDDDDDDDDANSWDGD